MPGAHSTRKATKKSPATTPSTVTTKDDVSIPGNSNTLSSNRCHPSTKQPAPKARRLKAQANTTVPTRTLPDQPGQNIHPAGLPEKKSRCSKEEIEAAHTAKLKALQEKIHAIQMAKERFVNMNIEKELDEYELPIRLSTKTHKWRWNNVEADSDEYFDLNEADDGLDVDVPSESYMAAETKTKSWAKKCVKGATRQELVTRAQELHGAKLIDKSASQQRLTHEVGRFTADDLCCKKYANLGLQAQSLTPPNADEPHQSAVADPFDFGGLCDDDLDDLVRIGGKSKDTQPDKPHAKCKLPKMKVAKTRMKDMVYDRQEPVDLQPFLGVCLDITEQCLSDSRWTHTFLLTMNHVLYLSNWPFADWTFESDTILPTVQMVFNLSFTNITYTLSLQDAVVKAAYNQMKMRRSKIASDVLQLVKTFFEGPQFKNREDIKAYVFWALQSGGPAYYETPIPKSCRLKIDDPNCPKPDGFLRSRFILPIARSYMSLAAKSALQPSLGPRNPLLGLYAMILTAVEHAMRAYTTGVFNPPGDFNQRTSWPAMQTFYLGFDRVHDFQWAEALDFNETKNIESPCTNQSLLSAFHMDFYIPSSPQKWWA
ncbi:hypothetical protein EI94DRAFT_1711676 [Lactarius quietus]|nr:hypothetical protein EI94DRAFT_1711676 [Lactarius quietus]